MDKDEGGGVRNGTGVGKTTNRCNTAFRKN